MTPATRLISFFWCVALFAAGQAVAQSPQQVQASLAEEEGAADEALPMPIGLSVTLANYVGQGTFVPGPTWNPYSLADISLTFTASLPWGFSLLIYEEAWLELTASDFTTTNWQPQMFDPSIRLGYGGLSLPAWGFSSSLELVGGPGLSLQSRSVGMIGSLGLAALVSYTVPWVGVTLWGRAQAVDNAFVPALADAFRSSAPVKPLVLEDGTVLRPQGCLRRSAAELGAYACGSLPSAASTSVSTGVSYWFWGDRLGIDVSFVFISFYTGYLGPNDRYTAAGATTGVGAQHSTSTALSFSYAPFSWLAFSAGTWSAQGLFTADGQWPRFPFWDFVSWRSNLSTVYAATTFTL